MIDINLFRVERGGNPELIRESQRKRNASVEVVDEIILVDKEWIKCNVVDVSYLNLVRFDADEVNRKIKLIQKEIVDFMKADNRSGAESQLTEKSMLEEEKKFLESTMDAKMSRLERLLDSVGNIVHESVPVSNDEVCNDPSSCYYS